MAGSFGYEKEHAALSKQIAEQRLLPALNQMLDILFAEPINIRKVTAGTMSENVGMIKIFENSGMHFEYKKLRQYCFEGRLIDMMAYYKENSK